MLNNKNNVRCSGPVLKYCTTPRFRLQSLHRSRKSSILFPFSDVYLCRQLFFLEILIKKYSITCTNTVRTGLYKKSTVQYRTSERPYDCFLLLLFALYRIYAYSIYRASDPDAHFWRSTHMCLPPQKIDLVHENDPAVVDSSYGNEKKHKTTSS